MAHIEKTLDSKEIFSGHVIRVTLDTVQLEDGSTAPREIVQHHGGACVLAVTEKEEIFLVRQYRYALKEELWELPAGKLEAGEDPFAAALRELTEECGVAAKKENCRPLGVLYPTVGYDSEKIYLYLATGLRPAAQHLDEGEFLDVRRLPFEAALKMVLNDEIRDAKTVAAVLKYALLRQKGEA